MNSVQKEYELKSRLFNDNYGKNSDVSDYFRYLDRIRTRKNKYVIPPEKNVIKKIVYQPFKDPEIIEANRRNKLKLYTIIDERPLPQLNNIYLEVREKIRHSKEKIREIAERALSVENSRFQDRVFNQKTNIEEIRTFKKLHKRRSKLMRNSRTNNYEEDYQKYSKKMQDLILPRINQHKEEKNDKLFQTEVCTNNVSESEGFMEKAGEKMKEHKYNEISHQKQGHMQ